jgi:hypothetical protein
MHTSLYTQREVFERRYYSEKGRSLNVTKRALHVVKLTHGSDYGIGGDHHFHACNLEENGAKSKNGGFLAETLFMETAADVTFHSKK